MEMYLEGAAVLLGVCALAVGILAVRQRRLDREFRGRLRYYHAEMERALALLDSPRQEEVLLALQLVLVLREPVFRRRALRRVSELTSSSDERVAEAAKMTLRRVLTADV